MPSVNKAIIVGHVGRDAELKYLATGTPMMAFTVATSERFKRGDEWEERTEWHSVTMFGDAAERLAQYVVKGAQVYVEGKIQTRSWDDKDGVKHYKTEINAQTVQTLGVRDKAPADTRSTQRSSRQAKPARDVDPDDLPWD